MARPGKGLLAVEEYARRKEQNALKAFGDSQTALAQGQQQLLDLEQFRTEYQAQMLQKGQQSTRMLVLQRYRRFIEQLDQVIGQQRERIVQLEAHRIQKRRAWLLSCNEKKRYQKLRENQRGAARSRELLQEQALIDDRAGRRS